MIPFSVRLNAILDPLAYRLFATHPDFTPAIYYAARALCVRSGRSDVMLDPYFLSIIKQRIARFYWHFRDWAAE